MIKKQELEKLKNIVKLLINPQEIKTIKKIYG